MECQIWMKYNWICIYVDLSISLRVCVYVNMIMHELTSIYMSHNNFEVLQYNSNSFGVKCLEVYLTCWGRHITPFLFWIPYILGTFAPGWRLDLRRDKWENWLPSNVEWTWIPTVLEVPTITMTNYKNTK